MQALYTILLKSSDYLLNIPCSNIYIVFKIGHFTQMHHAVVVSLFSLSGIAILVLFMSQYVGLSTSATGH